jgi:hypothetical protein
MVLMFLALFGILVFGWWPKVEQQFSIWWGGDSLSRKVGSIGGKPVTERELVQFRDQLVEVGNSIEQWNEYMARVAAEQKNDKIRVGFENMTANRSAIFYLWQKWPITSRQDLPSREVVLTWMAMYRDATKLGLSVPMVEAEQTIERIQSTGLPAALVGRAREGFVEGFRKDMTLAAYVIWTRESLQTVVDPELRADFAKIDQRVKVRLAILKASDVLDEVKAKDIPDADLKEQFDKCKKDLPGDGADGFGYRISDKVKIEYLMADPVAFEDEVKSKIKITDDDIHSYYERYKGTEFLAPDETPAAEGSRAEKKYKPEKDVKDDVTKSIIHLEAARLASAELHKKAIDIRQKTTPPNIGLWTEGAKIRLMVLPGFHTAAELKEMDGLGTAIRMSGGGTGQFTFLPDYAMQVEGLAKEKAEAAAEKDKDKAKAKPRAKLALMEMTDVFTDTGKKNCSYAFRVTAVKSSHEPDGLVKPGQPAVLYTAEELQAKIDKLTADVAEARKQAEAKAVAAGGTLPGEWRDPRQDDIDDLHDLVKVREQVVENVRQIKAFEVARDRIKTLLAAAEKANLDEAAKAAKIKTVDSGDVTRTDDLPEVGYNRKLIDECFQLREDKKNKLRMVTLTEKRMAVIVELLDEKAPRQALFEIDRQKLAQTLADRISRETIDKGVRDMKEVRARLDVVVEKEEDRGKSNEPAGPDSGYGSDD